MEIQQILQLFDEQERIDVRFSALRREQPVPEIVRFISLIGDEGFISYSRLNAQTADAAIREQVAYYEGIGQSFEWKVYSHDSPSDLRKRLTNFGFEEEDPEAVLVLDLEEAPAVLFKPVTHDLRRIRQTEEIAQVIHVQEAVWGEEFGSLSHYLSTTLHSAPDNLSIFVAFYGEKPVSTAWIYYHPGSQFAGLWGGSTLPEFRQRGFYTALLAKRAQEAQVRGIRFLTVDAGPMSRPILEKFGFQSISTAYACKWNVQKE